MGIFIARASQLVGGTDETNFRTFSRIPFGKEDKRIVRNAGKPQINVHFYVMAAMNAEQMSAEQIWQNFLSL